MKLGVLLAAFECEKELDQVLSSWIDYRNLGHDLIISATSCVFKEWVEAKIGFNNIKTSDKLHQLKNDGVIQYLSISDVPLEEKDARNLALKPLLDEKVDYVMLLDSDEFYSVKEILALAEFIQKDPFIAVYHIEFKNLVFDNFHFVKGFNPRRIWKRLLNDYRLMEFTFDNDCSYKFRISEARKQDIELSCKNIPVNLVNPIHFSWNDLERAKRKIFYQERRWNPPNGNGCSFKYNKELNKIEFNMDFFKRIQQSPPPVYELLPE